MLISDDQNLLLIAKWSLLVDTRRSACMYQCQHLACSNTQLDRCSHVETLLHTCTYWVCICQLLEGHNVLTRKYALQYPWSRIHARLSWASQTSLPEYMQLALNHFESALPQIRSQVWWSSCNICSASCSSEVGTCTWIVRIEDWNDLFSFHTHVHIHIPT